MSIWFTSDTHFGAERTLRISYRPFSSVKEMDEVLVRNWNSSVAPDDLVFHLGDFGDYSMAQYLNGQIILVQGNYERRLQDWLYKYENDFSVIVQDKVLRTSVQHPLGSTTLTYNLNMGHEPLLVSEYPVSEDTINLFGHIHKLGLVKRYGLNVGVDCHNFTPINLEMVLEYHRKIIGFFDENVFS